MILGNSRHRHEHRRLQRFDDEFVTLLAHQVERLLMAFAHGNDQKPTIVELIDQSLRNIFRRARHDYLVERCVFWPTLVAVTNFDENIINEAYNYGARGFLHKNCTAHDLKFAIDNIIVIGYNNVAEILKRILFFKELIF